MIYEKEERNSNFEQNNTADSELIDQAICNYFEAINQFDLKKWTNLFVEDGYIEDPVGSRPYIGHPQLAIFFKGVQRFFSEISMTIENKRQGKNYTKVLWKANATTYHDKKITFKGEEVFRINQKGKILFAEVYWDPSTIANQL